MLHFKAPENSKKVSGFVGPWNCQKGIFTGPLSSIILAVSGPWKLQKGPGIFQAPENAKKVLFKAPETAKKFERFFMQR